MNPVTVNVTVARERREVFDYLDVLANHEAFTDHLLKDWNCSGPARGVGAKVSAVVTTPAANERVEIEVVESDPPSRIVEQQVSARGKRRTSGTYRLEATADGGTLVSFELSWEQAPRLERLGAPLTRAFMRRANGKAMSRLAKQLAANRAKR